MTDNSHDDRLETAEEMATLAAPATRAPFATPKRLEKARDLARALAVAQNNAALYPASHPLAVQSIQDLTAAVAAIFEIGFEDVTINVYKATLFIENQVLPEESVTYRKLVVDLLARGISAVTFGPGFGEAAAAAVTELLNTPDIASIEQSTAFLRHRGAASVAVAETTDLDDSVREEEERENKARGRETYDRGIELMRDVETQAKLGKVFEVEPLQHMVSSLLDTLFKDPAAILGLTAIKGHDEDRKSVV